MSGPSSSPVGKLYNRGVDTVRRLLPYLKPYRARFFYAGIAMFFVAVLSGISVSLLGPVVDRVFINRDRQMLLAILWLLPTLFFLKMIAAYAQSYLMSFIGQRVIQDLRRDLFRHLHDLSVDFFWKRRSGEILSRVTNDLGVLQSGLHFVPLYLIRDTLQLTVLLGVLFYIQWKFALIAVTAMPVVGGVLFFIGRKLRSSSAEGQKIMGAIYHRFQESMQGMVVVKAFNYEEGAIRKFEEENASYFGQMMRYLRAASLGGPLMEFLGSLILTAILYLAGREILREAMKPGEFFTFLACFFAAYDPVKNLSHMNSTLQMALSGAERLFQILDEKPTVRELANPVSLDGLKEGIRFVNVSFRYPDRQEWALRNVNLHIRPGEVVAVAGPSGSGKTTLAHLLLRLFDPVEGCILVDGNDLRELSMKSLRSHIGLVTQDTVLFHDSVQGNISVGKPGATAREVLRALETAGADGFVGRLPQGLDTLIGDRGLKLSGGQRQRIAIARAVLKEPPILILDEATSNLDSDSERSVQQALEELFPGRTALVVAHRLATIQNAHRIVMLRQGEIAQVGSHSELLSRGGLYAMLYELQRLEPASA